MVAHSFNSFGWGEDHGFGLQNWPDGEMQRVKPCRPDFLAYEWGDFSLNPGLGDVRNVKGRRVLLQGPENSWKVLLGTGQQATIQNVGDVALGVKLTPEDTKSRKNLPVSVTTAQTGRFQIIVIVRKLAPLKEFCRKTKIGCLNSWTPCNVNTTCNTVRRSEGTIVI